MATAAAAPYDDGSSTESEYYFDPKEEAEEEAAYAWAHEHDAQVPQEPLSTMILNQPSSTVIKQEYSDCGQLQQDAAEITLPQGSEWSHGVVSTTVYDNAVEQALAMARELSEAHREEPLTDDTINSNASPIEKKEKDKYEKKTVLLTKSEEVKVKAKVVSLKKVKAPTPPASVTKSVVVGLGRSPKKVVGEPRELEKGLSVARPQLKSTEGQASSTQKVNPSQSKVVQAKPSDEKKTLPIQKEDSSKAPSVRKPEPQKVSISRRTEHSRSPSSRRRNRSRSPSVRRRKRSRSPSVRQRDRSRSPSVRRRNHCGSPPSRRTERIASPVRHYPRKSRSRSPLSRRFDEIRRRSRSRSPDRSSTPRSRSYRAGERLPSPRQNYNSDRRPNRPRSPSQPSRAYHSRFRSRSRSRSRDRSRDRHDFRPDHYDSSERKSVRDERNLDPRRPSHRESASVSREAHHIPTQRDEQMIEKRSDERRSGAVVHSNADRSASKLRLQEFEPLRSRRSISDKVVVSTAQSSIVESSRRSPRDSRMVSLAAKPRPTVETSKRSPRDPRIRPRVEASVAPNDSSATKKRGYVYHDAFARKVFKLKLQEADADEKAGLRLLSGSDKRFYEHRRQNIAADRAKLMAEDLERFEKLYNSTQVSSFDLKRYQADRSFASRVVQFKRKQASLQEQKDLFLSSEKQNELWRRLDKERAELIAENSVMFHKVMMDSMVPLNPFQGKAKREPAPKLHSVKHACGTNSYSGQAQLKRQLSMNHQHESAPFAANSRVVVGAALQLQDDNGPDNFKIPPAVAGNTPWFLKG